MNEKLIFISIPDIYIELEEKREHKGEKFYFKKLSNNSFLRGLALRGILRLLKLIIFKR